MGWLLQVAMAMTPGPYALEVDVVTETRLPVIGRRTVHTVSRALAELEVQGDIWRMTQRTCSVQVLGGGPADTTIPPGFVAALPVQEMEVDHAEGHFRVDGGPITVGAPDSGPLPTDASDPRVSDSDRDGAPGMTVQVDVPVLGGGEIYVVQRSHSVLDGRQAGSGAEGRVHVRTLEQHTLGASHKLLAADPPVEPVEGASRFRLVPAKTASCEAVQEALGS